MIKIKLLFVTMLVSICLMLSTSYLKADEVKSGFTSVPTVDFEKAYKKLSAEKKYYMQRQKKLLNERYDLSNIPSKDITMSRGKPIQTGVRVKLPKGVKSFEELSKMTPEEIKEKGLFPKGFLPLPHAKHEAGGQVYPQMQIDEIKKQEGRDLSRFDIEYDIPEHFLPEFPPAIYLTTRPDLGDVSKGELVTIKNYYRLFKDILTPKQLEGLRLLVTAFPQQEFNMTDDRKSKEPSRGVACFDCHANGHTNGAFHLEQSVRPHPYRMRIDTPTLRGVNIQRLFGSKRALKSVEDFTEFEQRGAYFDGDIVIATKKGVNVLERGSQVHAMAEFQEILDFPPAPKLNVYGKLIKEKATPAELRGQELFFGKAECSKCHTPPFYTDNLMYDLKVERFYKDTSYNGKKASAEGLIKNFPLRGLKDSPPYLHDGRLLTIEDTVEFFNLILELKLTKSEKSDLVAFLRCL
ncbi:MAG: cytochrome B6 [Deferribacterota bacterium]|nr:cytochrome B6 [Deferribacterota bacterium]